MPELERLAEVTSNFWGTKFQIVSHKLELLPANLGDIVYKPSLLHLQPRQMRLEMPDLKDDSSRDPFDWGDDDSDEDEEEAAGDSDEEGELRNAPNGEKIGLKVSCNQILVSHRLLEL